MKTGWIQTYTGGIVYPLELKPEDVNAVDIGVGLSRQYRYTGHTVWPYSVAEHSVHLYRLAPPRLKKAALLHDAMEAYIHDIPRPLKHLPEFALYREAEDRGLEVIFRRFGLDWPMSEELRLMDKRMIPTEYAHLFPHQLKEWKEAWLGVEGLDFKPECWSPSLARDAFLDAMQFEGLASIQELDRIVMTLAV
jgi:hypothetical protein